MTMSENNPPIASANIDKDRIISDADLFENFAVHYSKLMHKSKKKIREHLQQHAPRRSPRLVDKKLSMDVNPTKTKKNKKPRRSYSAISESNPEALIPVMKFSHLKQRRKMEQLASETKEKQTPSKQEEEVNEIIEIKDDDDYITEEIPQEAMMPATFDDLQYRRECEEVQIRIEENSSATSSCNEIPQPMQEEQHYIHHDYMHSYEQHAYVQSCPHPSMYTTNPGMYSAPNHHYQYHQAYAPQSYAPHSYAPHNPPSPYIPSVPPPSLTPESPAYSPCPETQPILPPQYLPNMPSFPLNTHVTLNSVQPSFEVEGKNTRHAEISLRFGPFHLLMRGYLYTYSPQDDEFLERFFIPGFLRPNSFPNNMSLPFPQAPPYPEFMSEQAPRENDNPNERLNSFEVDETMDESVSEEEPIPMEYGATSSQNNYNDFRDMEIDGTSDDEDIKDFSYDRPYPFETLTAPEFPEQLLPTLRGHIEKAHTTMIGKIRLRTDLTDEGVLSNVFATNDMDDFPVLIYLKYECDTEPRFFIVHNNILYQGVSGLTVFKEVFRDPWLEKIRALKMIDVDIKEEEDLD